MTAANSDIPLFSGLISLLHENTARGVAQTIITLNVQQLQASGSASGGSERHGSDDESSGEQPPTGADSDTASDADDSEPASDFDTNTFDLATMMTSFPAVKVFHTECVSNSRFCNRP